MTIGQTVREAGHAIKAIGLALALFAAPGIALAAPAKAPAATIEPAAPAATPAVNDDVAKPAVVAAPAAAVPAAVSDVSKDYPKGHFDVAPGGYTPLKPVEGVGMPIPGAYDLQAQYSPNGRLANKMHNWLVYVMFAIAGFVLVLLLIVIVRFNKRANPVASKTAHNTMLEVVWTGVPILILVAICVPSINLLRTQFKPAPAKALTVKATGNQWYWTYTYPDNGGFEVISNMLKEPGDAQAGEKARTDADGPEHLAVDNRMVIPIGEDVRLQTTGADVIHAFAVPSLWFKLDAVPGRLNEKVLRVDTPGVYYGQCSELCGVKHGYMPIVVEALPRDKFNAWVMTQGGKIEGAPAAPPAAAPAAAAPAAAKPAA